MEHPRKGYQMSPTQRKQQTSGMCSQDDLFGQQSNNPNTMGSYGNYGMPGINPSIMMDSRQRDLSRINGGNMVSPNYSPSMPSGTDAFPHAHTAPHAHAASHAHAAPHHRALNSQPSSYSHSQVNQHMQQQPPQAHMGMMHQCHHSITNQSIHRQGGQHAHSTGHRMPQVSHHKSSGGYGSSQPMVPRAHHVPQHPQHAIMLRNSSTQTFPSIHMEKEIMKQTLATEEKELEQWKRLDEQTKELERLIRALDSKEEMQHKQSEAIHQLLITVQRQDKELIKHQSDLVDAQEKIRGLQTALDNSYMEIAELHRYNASHDSKAQEAVLSAEIHGRESLEAALVREQRYLQEREAFLMQFNDLRLEMTRLEKEYSRHEDLLRQVIAHLQEHDLEDAQEKIRGLQTALDNSYMEIAELHRYNASHDSKAQEAVLSAETHGREALEAALVREQQYLQEREAFIMQFDDLRLEMTRLEKEYSRHEDLLRQVIAHLQEHMLLQQDEARSQDLTNSKTSAMLPLMRQIENLQATQGAQSAAWERVEKILTDRLALIALAMAQEKERTANNHLMEFSATAASLEAANKQEKAQLAAEVQSELEKLQDIRNSAVSHLESTKQRLNELLNELLNEQLKMDKQSDMHESGEAPKSNEAHEQCPSRPEDLEQPAKCKFVINFAVY